MFRLFALCALAIGACLIAFAAPPEPPSLKPSKAAVSGPVPAPGAPAPVVTAPAPPVSSPNGDILAAALTAADRSDWNELAQLQYRANDPVVRDLILWIRASNGVPGMDFEEITAAMDQLTAWPKQDDMRERAEDIIGLSSLSSRAQIDWLTASGPRTGAGKVALVNALNSAGETDRAKAVLRDAWSSHTLDRATESDIIARYGRWLTRADHEARAEFLMWTGNRAAALALKPQLGSDYRQLIDARLALAGNAKKVDQLVEAVPAHLTGNPGLLYERARYRRKRDNQEGASSLLLGIDGKSIPMAGRNKLWGERSLAAREDFKNNDWVRAYELVAPHGLVSGEDFAEAEFMSGWIALRHRSDPVRGLRHFETLANGVSAPVSVARAAYWTGRAHESLGARDLATNSFKKAAGYRFTYYGQLAAERSGDRKLSFATTLPATQSQRLAFEGRPLVRALRLLGDARQSSYFRELSFYLDDQLTSETEYLLLAELARSYDLPEIAVRGAKAGLARGIVTPEAAYPLVDYPLQRSLGVERSLMLALTRQESEMNPYAVSGANARGLMQLVPLTAKSEARRLGLPYQTSFLTSDPGYNMTLGGAYLDTLLGEFNGSYIMTAAAYNAGPSRPRRWVDEYGDPRTGAIDPVDWVESIPFEETRNYVMRVMENTQVYRHRLSGREEDIRLSQDLNRGRR